MTCRARGRRRTFRRHHSSIVFASSPQGSSRATFRRRCSGMESTRPAGAGSRSRSMRASPQPPSIAQIAGARTKQRRGKQMRSGEFAYCPPAHRTKSPIAYSKRTPNPIALGNSACSRAAHERRRHGLTRRLASAYQAFAFAGHPAHDTRARKALTHAPISNGIPHQFLPSNAKRGYLRLP